MFKILILLYEDITFLYGEYCIILLDVWGRLFSVEIPRVTYAAVQAVYSCVLQQGPIQI